MDTVSENEATKDDFTSTKPVKRLPYCFRKGRMDNYDPRRAEEIEKLRLSHKDFFRARKTRIYIYIGLFFAGMPLMLASNYVKVHFFVDVLCEHPAFFFIYLILANGGICISIIIGGIISDCSKLTFGRRKLYLFLSMLGFFFGMILCHHGFISDVPKRSYTAPILLGMGPIPLNLTGVTDIVRCRDEDRESISNLGDLSSFNNVALLFGIVLVTICQKLVEVFMEAIMFDTLLPDLILEGLKVKSITLGTRDAIIQSIFSLLLHYCGKNDAIRIFVYVRFILSIAFILILLVMSLLYLHEIPRNYLVEGYQKVYFNKLLLDERIESEDDYLNSLNYPDGTRKKESLSDEIKILETYFKIKCLQPTFLSKYIESIFKVPKFLKKIFILEMTYYIANDTFSNFLVHYIIYFATIAPFVEQSKMVYADSLHIHTYYAWVVFVHGITCFVYSSLIIGLIVKFGIQSLNRTVLVMYICALTLLFCIPHEIAVLLLSISSGMLKVNAFIIPSVLLAHFYETNDKPQLRGVATDLAIKVSCQLIGRVFLFIGNFILAWKINYLISSIIFVSAALTININVMNSLKYNGPESRD